MVRLHLGCGKKKYRGYINVDSFGNPDQYHDITALPYGENYADEILLVHVFEHIFPWKVLDVLKHWHRILKPGGRLIMEMPDLVKVLQNFAAEKPHPALTFQALYGGERSERIEDLHKWCWTFESVKPVLEQAGYREIVQKPCLYHVPLRDFRVEAVK